MENLSEKELERFRNMEPFETIDDIPDLPQVDNPEEYEVIIENLIRCGAIPKKELEIGVTYLGSCRNNSKAIWNGKCFDYQRTKWGDTYWSTIEHFEDERYSDVFIPIKKLN